MIETNTKKDSLTLFTYTQPSLIDGLAVNTKADENNRVIGITMSLEKRKVMADKLGLKGKLNADALTSELLKLSDRMKETALGEFVKLGASPDWTGGRFSIKQSKSGVKRATLSLVTVNRNGHVLTKEQLVKALSSMTEDEQIAVMEAADALKSPAIPLKSAATV